MMKATTEKLWAAPEEICRNEEQPRTYFAAEELERLGASLARKQNQPVTVIPIEDGKGKGKVRWKIVDGERRWRAAKAKGLKRLWIVVDDDVTSEAELHTASFTANWCRAGHTHAETAAAIDRERNEGKTYEEIAELVGKSTSWANNQHSLLKLHPDLMALLDPPTPKAERLSIAVAYALTKFPIEKQIKVWKQHQKKGRDAYHHVRVAAGQTARRPSYDARYMLGKVLSVQQGLKHMTGLPGRMLGGLTVETRERLAAQLDDVSTEALNLAGMLRAVAQSETEGGED
jgi:ParB family transcriptional regulator, chromosome partitioning protein